MILNKVNENVEYYVIVSTESPDVFVFTDDGKVTDIQLPKNIKCMRDDYLFIYVGNMRAHPENDYTIEGNIVKFRRPMSNKTPIVVKMYTKHDVDRSNVSCLLEDNV